MDEEAEATVEGAVGTDDALTDTGEGTEVTTSTGGKGKGKGKGMGKGKGKGEGKVSSSSSEKGKGKGEWRKVSGAEEAKDCDDAAASIVGDAAARADAAPYNEATSDAESSSSSKGKGKGKGSSSSGKGKGKGKWGSDSGAEETKGDAAPVDGDDPTSDSDAPSVTPSSGEGKGSGKGKGKIKSSGGKGKGKGSKGGKGAKGGDEAAVGDPLLSEASGEPPALAEEVKEETEEEGQGGRGASASDNYAGTGLPAVHSLVVAGEEVISKLADGDLVKDDATAESLILSGPNELLVVLVQARGLVHPSSRVFEAEGIEVPLVCASVVMQCNDQVVRSAIVPGTSTPIWRESHRFLVSNARKGLVVTLEHHDPIGGDTVIGRFTVPLKTLEGEDGRRRDKVEWFHVEAPSSDDERPEVFRGGVRLGLRWRFSAFALAEATAGQEKVVVPAVVPAVVPERVLFIGDNKPKPEEPPGEPPPLPNQLSIKVVMARGLPESKVKMLRRNGDTCNPLCTVVCGGVIRRTRVKNKTTEPLFEEMFTFALKAPDPNAYQRRELFRKTAAIEFEIQIEDDDKEAKNELLGSIKQPLVLNEKERHAKKAAEEAAKPKKKTAKTPKVAPVVEAQPIVVDWRTELLEGRKTVRRWFPLVQPKSSGGGFLGGMGGMLGMGKSKKKSTNPGPSGEEEDRPEVLLELMWTFNEDLLDDDDADAEDDGNGDAGYDLEVLQASALESCRALVGAWDRLRYHPDALLHPALLVDGPKLRELMQGDADKRRLLRRQRLLGTKGSVGGAPKPPTKPVVEKPRGVNVRVAVIEAKELMARDRSGTSDPYVVIEVVDSLGKVIKGTTRKTSTIQKTLAPVWSDASFEFDALVGNPAGLLAADALEGAKGFAAQLRACLDGLSLRIAVFDADTLSSDKLGQVDLKIDFLAAGGSGVGAASWHDLKGTFGGKEATGSVKLHLACTPPSPPPLDAKLRAQETGKPKVDGEQFFEEFDYDYDDEKSHGSDGPKPNILKVAVIAGRQLIAADIVLMGPSASDPQAKIKVTDDAGGGSKRKPKRKNGAWAASTRVIKQTLEPKWNETFDLNVPFSSSAVLEVQVEDWDLVGAHDFLGKFRLPLASVGCHHRTYRAWVPLEGRKGGIDKPRGAVEVALRWVYDDERASETKLQGSILSVLAATSHPVLEADAPPLTIDVAAAAAKRVALAANMWCRIAAVGINCPSPYSELALKFAPPPQPDVLSGQPHVPLGAGSVFGRAVASDRFTLPGGSLADRKARAEGKGARASVRSDGDVDDDKAAVVKHKTAEEDEHDRKKLERRMKAAKKEDKGKKHVGGAKPPSESPPPDPARWLLQAEVFRLSPKDHLLPIMRCLAGQDLARLESVSRLFYYPIPNLKFLSLPEAAARASTLVKLAAGISALAPGVEPPAVPLTAVSWKIALAAATQTAALTQIYMETEGWRWRRRDFWGVGPDSEPSFQDAKRKRALAAALGATGIGDDLKRGDDDETDVGATFRFASVSGQRAATGMELTPFDPRKGRAGRLGAMSASERLKRMYGVRCRKQGKGNDEDGADEAKEEVKAAENMEMSAVEKEALRLRELREMVLVRLYSIDVEKADDPEADRLIKPSGADEAVAREEAEKLAAASGTGPQETLIVTALELRANGLTKRLPNAFHGLRSLVSLDLSGNGARLTGPIPRSIGELEALRKLNLNSNNFSGVIPTVVFDRLRSLEVVDLSFNAFTGHLPAFDWAHYMGSTEDDDDNGADGDESVGSAGTFASSVAGSSVGGNSVDNEIKAAARAARRAKRAAAVEKARRAGKSSHPLSHLEVMDLSNNRLAGALPGWLRTLPAIRRLSLANNRFEGTLDALLLPPPGADQSGAACDAASPAASLVGRSVISVSVDDETATYGFGWGLKGSHSLAEGTHASTLTPSRAPPALVDYLRTVFQEHDRHNEGVLAWHELWWLFKGLGLGLLDGDIAHMQSKANARRHQGNHDAESETSINHNAALSFNDFAPVALGLLRDCFDAREWGRTKRDGTPWVRLYDKDTAGYYYYNCETDKSEWVTGDAAQAARVGTPLTEHKESRLAAAYAAHMRLQAAAASISGPFAGGLYQPDTVPVTHPLPPVPLKGRPFLGTLRRLDLSRNALSGSVHASVGFMRGLIEMDLSQNRLTGSLPLDALAYSRDLRHISVFDNPGLLVPSEVLGMVDLSKALGVGLAPDATVLRVDHGGAQGGLAVGCRLVAVGDASVSSPAEVDKVLARWRFQEEAVCPITFVVPLPNRLEKGLLIALAKGNETRLAVDGNSSRFHPSKWTNPDTSGACPGRDFFLYQERLPALVNLRSAGKLLGKKWDIKSATQAFDLGLK